MTGYLYRCFDDTGRLIYIGSTKDVSARMLNHRAHTWWASQIADTKVTPYPSLTEARAAERDAIAAENPRWNTQGRWVARDRWTEADYRDYSLARHTSCPHSSFNREHLARVAAEYALLFGRSLDFDLARESA